MTEWQRTAIIRRIERRDVEPPPPTLGELARAALFPLVCVACFWFGWWLRGALW